MRRTMFIAAAVLAAALALCFAEACRVENAVSRAEALLKEAVEAVEVGDVADAREKLVNLRKTWQNQRIQLEVVTSHDALYAVDNGLEDALVCLRDGQRVEFTRAATALHAALEWLRTTEAIRVMNLF